MNAKQIGSVRQIWRYPISSLMGETVESVSVTKAGFAGDRIGAFFDAETLGIASPPTPRKWSVAPLMAARTGSAGEIEIATGGTTWQPVDSPSLIEAVSELFGSRMMFRRYGEYSGDVLFKQRYAWKPVHIISIQSLESLQQQLAGEAVDVRRFRPNIVADLSGFGKDRPEYELIGREFTISGVRLRGLGPSGRCSFTTLAQRGLPEDRSVLKALIANFDKDFGIYCDVVSEGEIAPGDAINLERTEAAGHPAAVAVRPRPGPLQQAANRSAGTASGPKVRIGSLDEFPSGEIRRIEVPGAGALAVFRTDAAVYAVSDRCPHAGAPMSEGILENGRIVCPLHFAEFDPQTGEPFNAPTGCRHLKCYLVERQGNELSIRLQDDQKR